MAKYDVGAKNFEVKWYPSALNRFLKNDLKELFTSTNTGAALPNTYTRLSYVCF